MGVQDQTNSKSLAQILRDAHLELSVLCSTKHPNVVSFVGVPAYFPDESDPDQSMSFGFVFEFCAHGSLFSLLHEKNAKFMFKEKIRMAKELATGLLYLHSQQIIHRDVSSRNILITGDLTVKIADFGCARKIPGGIYQPTTISGNPPWMSPEQLGGLPLTSSADVWSFGVVFWEQITELLPWDDVPNDLWAIRQLVFDQAKHLPIPQIAANSPETQDESNAVAMLIKRSFLRNPAARPTMSVIINALQAILDHRVRFWIEEYVGVRRAELEEKLTRFFVAQNLKAQTLPTNDEIGLLAKLHCEDCDDTLINLYLSNKYQADLSNLPSLVQMQPLLAQVMQPMQAQVSAPPMKQVPLRPDYQAPVRTDLPVPQGQSNSTRSTEISAPNQPRYTTHLCKTCPHFYGDEISGHHDLLLPDGSRYVGDLLNGTLHGLGVLISADGHKAQGEFQQNRLSIPFSVESIRLTLKAPDDKKLDHETLSASLFAESTDLATAQKIFDVPVAELQANTEPDRDMKTSQAKEDVERRKYLASKIALFVSALGVTNQEDVNALAEDHGEDSDDTKINTYLRNKYGSDLSCIEESTTIKQSRTPENQKRKGATVFCRDCPHFYGEPLSGYHEVILPDGARYTGDLLNGNFFGLGILTTANGDKVQGQFQNNQLVLSFSVDSIKRTLKPPEISQEVKPEIASNQTTLVQEKPSKTTEFDSGSRYEGGIISNTTAKAKSKISSDRYNDIVQQCLKVENEHSDTMSSLGMEHPVFEPMSVADNLKEEHRTVAPPVLAVHSENQPVITMHSVFQPPEYSAPPPLKSHIYDERTISGMNFTERPRGGTPGPQINTTMYQGIPPGLPRASSHMLNEKPARGTPVPLQNFSSVAQPADLPRRGTPGPQYNFAALQQPQSTASHNLRPNLPPVPVLVQRAIPQSPAASFYTHDQRNVAFSAQRYAQPNNFSASQEMAYHRSSAEYMRPTQANFNQPFVGPTRQAVFHDQRQYEGSLSRAPLAESRTDSRQNVLQGALAVQPNYARMESPFPSPEKLRSIERSSFLSGTQSNSLLGARNLVRVQHGAPPSQAGGAALTTHYYGQPRMAY